MPALGSFSVGLAVTKYTLCSARRASSTLSTTGAGGGGGLFTVTEFEAEAVKPRESVQVAFTVALPAEAPVVLSVALSGLVHEQVMVEDVPISTVAGFAEQEICGGFSGFTVKFEVQLAVPFFLDLASVTVAVTV